jgi:imidazoleglycerol phosphate dehydratase HisB
MTVQVKDVVRNEQAAIKARLTVDASGRHDRLVSKNTRIEQVEGFNTHAFWAYFDCIVDEREIPLRYYESVNTYHLCIAEG